MAPSIMIDLLPWKEILIGIIKVLCKKIVCDNGTEDEDIIEYCGEYWQTPPGNSSNIILIDISAGSKVALSVLYCLSFTMALVGNVVVLITFCCGRRGGRARNGGGGVAVHNVLIVNLAVSDLLVVGFCMPFNVAAIHSRWWDFGALSGAACKLVPYAQALAVVAGVLTLTAVAGERYVAVVLPLKARTADAACRVLVLVAYIWTTAAVVAVPNAVWYTLIDLKDIDVNQSAGLYALPSPYISSAAVKSTGGVPCEDANLDHTHIPDLILPSHIQDDIPERTPHDSPHGKQDVLLDVPDLGSTYLCVLSADDTERMKIYQFMFFGLLFVFPLVSMVFIYGEVGYRLWVRHTIGNQSLTYDQMRLRTSKRVVAMFVVVLLLFVVCWAPLQIFTLFLFVTNPETNETNLNLRYYLQWLALSNSAFNPLVYTFLHEKFRKSVEIRCCCKSNKIHHVESAAPQMADTGTQEPGNHSNSPPNTDSSPVPTKY